MNDAWKSCSDCRATWFWPKSVTCANSWTVSCSADGPGADPTGSSHEPARKQSCEEATSGRCKPLPILVQWLFLPKQPTLHSHPHASGVTDGTKLDDFQKQPKIMRLTSSGPRRGGAPWAQLQPHPKDSAGDVWSWKHLQKEKWVRGRGTIGQKMCQRQHCCAEQELAPFSWGKGQDCLICRGQPLARRCPGCFGTGWSGAVTAAPQQEVNCSGTWGAL